MAILALSPGPAHGSLLCDAVPAPWHSHMPAGRGCATRATSRGQVLLQPLVCSQFQELARLVLSSGGDIAVGWGSQGSHGERAAVPSGCGTASPWHSLRGAGRAGGLPRSLGAAKVPLHGAPGRDTTGRWLLTLPGDLNPPEGSGRDQPCSGRGMNPSPPPHTPSPQLLPAAPGGPGLCWGRGGGPAAHAGGRVAGAAGRPQPSFLRCWVPLCC